MDLLSEKEENVSSIEAPVVLEITEVQGQKY